METQQTTATSPRTGLRATVELELALLAVIWGVNFSVIKVALESVSALGFNALRFPLAATVLVLALRKRSVVRPRRSDVPRLLAVGLAGNVVYQLMFIVGLDATLAGNASILLATAPVWTAIFSVWSGHERVSASFWVGASGTVVGIVFVVLGGASNALLLGRDTVLGDLLILIAAVVWALYTVWGRPLVDRYGSLPATAWTLWIGTVPLVLIGAPTLTRSMLTDLGPTGWLAIAYAGILGIGVAYLIWYRGVAVLGSARTAIYSNTVPIVALAVAWVWLGERPGALQYLGGALVLLGVAWTRRARVTPRTPTAVGA